MKVMLVGGPFNGWVRDVKESRGFPEERELWFPIPGGSKRLFVDDFLQPANNLPLGQLLYVLEPTYLTDKPHNFEYHYQGR